MQGRIILAPGCNGTELLRSLAMHRVNTFNWRIMNAVELARYALMHSGIAIKEEIISTKEEIKIVQECVEKFLKTNPSGFLKNASYNDVKNLAATLRRMRLLVKGKEIDEDANIKACINQGEFQEKNSAIIEIYDSYKDILSVENKIDSVGLIRKAVEFSKALSTDIYILDEYPIAPLEEELVEKILGENSPNNGVNRINCGIINLFEIEDRPIPEEQTYKISEYRNCYGAANEVEKVLDDVYSKIGNIDKCTIAIADSEVYSQLFYDYALLHNIPTTFETGVPITNSNPAGLLKLYNAWAGGNLFAKTELKAILDSAAFNKFKFKETLPQMDWEEELKFWGIVLNLNFTNVLKDNLKKVKKYADAVREDALVIHGTNNLKALRKLGKQDKDAKDCYYRISFIKPLEQVAELLAVKPQEFINRYTYLRMSSENFADKYITRLDTTARKVICEELAYLSEKLSLQEMVSEILGMKILREGTEQGKLHITTISGALNTLRENLFIIGLSAKNYPGAPKENYLLLDGDLVAQDDVDDSKDREIFDGGKKETSTEKVKRKYANFEKLLELASFIGVNITLSYAGMDVSELKDQNPSSLFYKVAENDGSGEKLTIKDVGYFDPRISALSELGQAYNDDYKVIIHAAREEKKAYKVKCAIDKKGYSPSSFSGYLDCPRKFMFKSVLGINVPDELEPLTILSAADKGSLAHSLMRLLGASRKRATGVMGKDEFISQSGLFFDRFIAENPPLISNKTDSVKEEFLILMGKAYDQDKSRFEEENFEIALEEKEVKGKLSGVNFHGYPDRVEKLSNNKYRIVDFKTGLTNKQDVKLTEKEKELSQTEQNAIIQDRTTRTFFQTFIYAYLINKNKKNEMADKVEQCEFRYPSKGETPTCENKLFDGSLEAIVKEFKEKMKVGKFDSIEKNVSKEPCKYCDYKEICYQDSSNEQVMEDRKDD